MMKIFKNLFLVLPALMILGGMSNQIWAQSGSGNIYSCGAPDCIEDFECQNPPQGDLPCPSCFVCDTQQGFCVPNDLLCNDGSGCTTGICSNANIAPGPGCIYTSLLIGPPPPDDLPIDCYVCEPTANGVDVANGICEPGAGEDCDNSVDCREDPSMGCITPPLNPGNDCDSQGAPRVVCNDNNRCTLDTCPFDLPSDQFVCDNQFLGCSAISDGCCPQGCVSPGPGEACPAATNDPTCDPDCWPGQVCGDGLIEPPETCDASANMEFAGVDPQGQPVPDEICRPDGTVVDGQDISCTYCGDEIVQAGEECDGTDASACESGLCQNDCSCAPPAPPVNNVCVTGSGVFWDTIRPGCGNCSFNPLAADTGMGQTSLAYLTLALFGMGSLMVLRRRRS